MSANYAHSAAAAIDASRLNDFGKRRLASGVRCFVRPEGFRSVEAVCVDFGFVASGKTIDEAKQALESIIDDFCDLSWSNGTFYDFLNTPDNEAAVRQHEEHEALRRRLEPTVARIVAVFAFIAAVRQYCSAMFKNEDYEYRAECFAR